MIDPWASDPRPPRRWQTECYPLAMAAIRARERGVVHACTGAGKTRLQLAVLATVCATLRPGWRVVVTVPKVSLVEQTGEDVRRALGAVALYYTRRKQIDAPVVVACVDSLPGLVDDLTARGLRVALWMADECHRANTPEVRALVEEGLRPVTRIGLTATPFRALAGDALIGWDRVVYSYPIDRAIEEGVLVPWRTVEPREGDPEDATEATIAMILRDAPAGPGIVSATDTTDANLCAEALTRAGIPARAIHSKHSRADRAAAISDLEAGRLRCLVHVDLLTEGVDLPWLRWLAMRRPRASAVAIVQEVGRVLRTCGGKTEAVVLLPHLTPVLRAVMRPAELAATPVEAARRLREAAESEADPYAETMLPTAVAVGDVDGWISAVVERVRAAGLRVEPKVGGWRDMVPSGEQVRLLDGLAVGHRSPVRYLPESQRDAVRAVIQRPEVLSRGAASDLLTTLLACRREAGRVWHERQERWRLPVERWPEPPAVGKPKRKREAA